MTSALPTFKDVIALSTEQREALIPELTESLDQKQRMVAELSHDARWTMGMEIEQLQTAIRMCRAMNDIANNPPATATMASES